jgi:hypothetical protein
MDLESLAKELHGEVGKDQNSNNEDPYSEDYSTQRN